MGANLLSTVTESHLAVFRLEYVSCQTFSLQFCNNLLFLYKENLKNVGGIKSTFAN